MKGQIFFGSIEAYKMLFGIFSIHTGIIRFCYFEGVLASSSADAIKTKKLKKLFSVTISCIWEKTVFDFLNYLNVKGKHIHNLTF